MKFNIMKMLLTEHVCSGQNEIYNNCGPPRNCEIGCKISKVVCNLSCNPGCFCIEGYVRHESKCIPDFLCP